MLPIAKAAVLTVLLGGGTVGAYALTGGFGGSGNGNETTAQEGTTESNTVPSQPVPADAPQVAQRGPEVNGAVDARAPEGTGADATQLSDQGQAAQRDPGTPEPDQTPERGETQDTPVVQNTVSEEEPGAAKVDGASGQTPEVGGGEAEVTLGEGKNGSPSGEDGASCST